LSFADAYNLPIHRRKWWINQISEIADRQNKNQESAQRMQPQAQANSPRARKVGH